MVKPKTVFTPELAKRAQAALNTLGWRKGVHKLIAIAAAKRYSVATVAKVFGVAETTIWRWARAYDKKELDGILRIPKKPTPEQEAVMRTWLEIDDTTIMSPFPMSSLLWDSEDWEKAIYQWLGLKMDTNKIKAWLRRNGFKKETPIPQYSESDWVFLDDFRD